jgi:hypothetical protein
MNNKFSEQERTDLERLPELTTARVNVDADALLLVCDAAGDRAPDQLAATLAAHAIAAKAQAVAALLAARRADPALAAFIARKLRSSEIE